MVNSGAQLGQTYQTFMPAFSDNADIQQAMMMLWYGDPNATSPTSKGIEKHLSDLSSRIEAVGAKSTTDVIFSPSAPTRNTVDYTDWIWVDTSKVNSDGASRPVNIWNGTAWSRVAGAADPSLDYVWSGSHIFSKPLIVRGPVNAFGSAADRTAGLPGATNGTLSWINGNYEVLRDGVWFPLASTEKTIVVKPNVDTTMTESDADKLLSFTNQDQSTYTIGSNQIKVGNSVIIHRASASTLTINPGAGVNIRAANRTIGQYASATLTKIGTDEWIIQGGGSALPTGGTAGQALTKIDGTDYKSEWTSIVPQSGGSFTGKVTVPELETPSLKIGGSRIYIQPTQPTDMAKGDVWVQT